MAQVSYEEFQMDKEARDNRSNTPRVGYLALKNDQDEAIVRFMHNSTADFDILYVHPEQINNRYRNVNCISNGKKSDVVCPLCAAKHRLQTKIYIHLIEYTKDEKGNIVGTPKLWERPASYITTLKNLCDEYAPLSENIFKIKRNGAAGSMDTTYAIMYASPNIYRNEMYKKDEHAFDGIKALGTAVLSKTMEEMNAMVNGTATAQAPTASKPAYEPVYTPDEPQYYQQVSENTHAYQTPVQSNGRTYDPQTVYPQESIEPAFNRPKRLG